MTYYGTSTLLLDDGRTQFLVDAFLTRPSREAVVESLTTGAALIGSDPATVDAWTARPEVRSPAAIFATHSHHDHALDVAAVALRTGAQVHGFGIDAEHRPRPRCARIPAHPFPYREGRPRRGLHRDDPPPAITRRTRRR